MPSPRIRADGCPGRRWRIGRCWRMRDFLLGVVALQSGRADEAVALIGAAVRQAPDPAQYHFNLGSALGLTGQPDEVVGAYDRDLALEPEKPEAAWGKATALLALGRLIEARAALDQAVALRPERGEPVWVLSRFDAYRRWMLGRRDSPWYRTALRFRQSAFGDWDSVFKNVAAVREEEYGQAV
jgi:tetratricopeptide (TPR) repeat protein